jgi:lipoprotein-releasing system permease protein
MLELRIAFRYLVAKKSANAINVITLITMMGVVVGSAAFILILSGLNGFETLIGERFGLFNPDLKIEARQGKVFEADSALLARLRAVSGVAAVSCTLEEVALFAFDDAQSLGMLKGVDDGFVAVSELDSVTEANADGGRFELRAEGDELYFAVAGAGLAAKLGLVYDDRLRGGGHPIRVYMAKRGNAGGGGLGGGQPFKSRSLQLGGTFEILQDFNNHIFVELGFVRELLSYSGNEVGALEIKLAPDASPKSVERSLREVLGEGFTVKNRFAQDETFYKITNMERWAVFAILCLAYAIVAFNMISALWMLALEKRRDVAMLVAMGATSGFVRRIFLLEGALISLVGSWIGFALATLLVWAQQTFHLVGMEGNLIIQHYPMNLRAGDYLLVWATIMAIGLLAAWLPASRAAKTDGLGALVNAS